MANISKLKSKQIVLIGLMAVLVILLFRQYMPMVELPTNGLIEDELVRLKSLRNDLAVEKKMNIDWQQEQMALASKASIFWVRTKPGIPVEQEVLEEFNNIVRLASVNIQTKESKLLKVPNSNYIQEVELKLEMRGASMREFSRLLSEIETNRRRFFWASCRIDPDNPLKPTGVRVSARLKAFIMTEEGGRLLYSAPVVASNGTGISKALKAGSGGVPSKSSSKLSSKGMKTVKTKRSMVRPSSSRSKTAKGQTK